MIPWLAFCVEKQELWHYNKSMKERDYNFYICQIEWVLDDTYKEEEK